MKIKIAPKIFVVTLIFAIIFAGVISSYSFVIIIQDYKIASLNTQVQNLNSEIENLTNQIPTLQDEQTTNLTAAYLASGLKANLTTVSQGKEIITSNYAATKSIPYNYFYISGSVTNTGNGTAFEAGLHVIAYDVYDKSTRDIDMTLPFGGTFGTDDAINAYVAKSQGGTSSFQLESLGSGQTKTINIQIFHEGTVSNWIVTPVWTNSP
jgi:outer membrane murein-binding lipoprotein Lpp